MTHLLDEDDERLRHALSPVRRPPLRLHLCEPAPEPGHGPVDARARREAGRSLGLSALLGRRPDLAGVHAPADLADEFLRWCL